MSSTTNITISKYLSEEKQQILSLINQHHNVLLESNPNSGKTHLFKLIAKDIVDGKRKGRLVFMAPFIIIQDQFKNELANNGVKVDLELNHKSKRKKIKDSDKIISSTFKSFHHIANDLTEDDIVVIDESHALFYAYEKNSKKDIYLPIVDGLYDTKAKLVFMSGTPNMCLLDMFELHHIKVTKSQEIKATININFSKQKILDIAREFAENAHTQYGETYVNFIYVKSIKECNNIAKMLEDIGYSVAVVTSLNKEDIPYQTIAEIEEVPKGVQFVITTNVISTGANIKNANIGTALMLNESNPLEIKQFAKRFRKMPDIEIDLVINPYGFDIGTLSQSMIQKQRTYSNESLEFYKKANKNRLYDFNYEDTFNTVKAIESTTPNDSIKRILKQRLVQESFYIEDSLRSIDSSNLEDLLNEYDDIQAKTESDYKVYEADWEDTKNLLLNNFKQDQEEYLTAICKAYPDYYIKNMVKKKVEDEFKLNVKYSKHIIEDIKNPVFYKEIIESLIKYRDSFESTSDFIQFLEKKNKKNVNTFSTSCYINKMLNNYFDVKTSQAGYNAPTHLFHELKLKDRIDYDSQRIEKKILLKLIQEVFKYCINREHIIIKNLKDHLENNFALKNMTNNVNEISYYPLDYIINKKGNGFSLNETGLKAILQGIFYVKEKKVTIKSKQTRAFKFIEKLPQGISSRELDLSIHLMRFRKRTVKKVPKNLEFNIVEKMNYLSNHELLFHHLK